MSEMGYKKTAYICELCRKADKEKRTHPGAHHPPGICDCSCRDHPRRQHDVR